MPTIDNVIYNVKNIELWRSEIPKLEKLSQEVSQQIITETPELERLSSRISLLNSQIRDLDTQILLLQSTQNRQHYHYYHDHHHHHHNHHHYASDFFVDVSTGIQLNRLREQWSNLSGERSSLLTSMQRIENRIESLKKAINNAKTNIAWLQKHITEGEEFLTTLNNNPTQLIVNLQQKILQKFSDYAYYHPAALSPRVRFCLFNIQWKLNLITPPPTGQLYPSLPIHTQIRYLSLTAFVWEMYHQVEDEAQDEDFKNLLIELINKLHIPDNGDLPDSLRTGKGAYAHLHDIKTSNPYDMSNENLYQYETDIFKYHLGNLKNYLRQQNAVQISIARAVSLIEEEISLKAQKNETIDYHFYTAAVSDFLQILSPQPNNNAIRHLGVLAEHASGTASLGKKIGGALLMVAGIALVAASIVGLAATFGGSSFFSAAGIALGLSLLQFQVAFGTFFAATAIAGSGLTFFGGRTFKEGKQQGLSKELVTLQETCNNPDSWGPSAPQYGVAH